jgi:hypothetical protein
MLRNEIYELPKLPLVLPEFLLRPFLPVNVGQQAIPTDDATLGITLWTRP